MKSPVIDRAFLWSAGRGVETPIDLLNEPEARGHREG
jgi:hypothetical protein